jgi:tRNA uridine 5-carboxymethylaminomethyl modification enzyme
VILPAEFTALAITEREEVLYRVTYAGYLAREARHVARLQEIEKVKIPSNFDFGLVKGLRTESLTKLKSMRPLNLGQASRISGVNPADISILLIYIEAGRKRSR